MTDSDKTSSQDQVKRLALAIRRNTFDVAVAKNGAYLGQACSAAEIFSVLYLSHMKNEDCFVLSPAHYCLPLYIALNQLGEIEDETLAGYMEDGSPLEMIGGEEAPGLEFTCGSLGQGLSGAIGLAFARRIQGQGGHIFVFVSDGELEEGQTWEALLCVSHWALTEIVVLVDSNSSQVDGNPSNILDTEPILEKLQAFNFKALEIDGHDIAALDGALSHQSERPLAILCRTNIWQGIPSMKGRPNLHYVRFRDGEAERVLQDLTYAAEALR